MVMHILLFVFFAACCALGREDMVIDPEIDFVTHSFLFQTVSQKAYSGWSSRNAVDAAVHYKTIAGQIFDLWPSIV